MTDDKLVIDIVDTQKLMKLFVILLGSLTRMLLDLRLNLINVLHK